MQNNKIYELLQFRTYLTPEHEMTTNCMGENARCKEIQATCKWSYLYAHQRATFRAVLTFCFSYVCKDISWQNNNAHYKSSLMHSLFFLMLY